MAILSSLIPKLKAPLRGHRFHTQDNIAIAVRRLIMTNFSHGEARGIRRLPHRWQRSIDSLGDYFEGVEPAESKVFFRSRILCRLCSSRTP